MAVFTPQAQSISPEAPVSVGGGLGGLEVAAKLFGSAMTDSAKSPTAGEVDATRRRELINGLQTIRSTLDEGNTTRAVTESKNLISNYVARGGVWNDEARAIAASVTGLPANQFGMTQAELDRASEFEVRQARMEDPTFIATMTLVARENPSLEGDALYAAASNRLEERLANEQLLLEAQTTGQVDWEAVVRTAMVSRTDEFITTSLGSLVDMSENGIPIDIAKIDQVQNAWTGLRARDLSRPANVTDSQWTVMQEKFDQVDNMFANLRRVTTSEYGVERLKSFATQLVGITDLQGASVQDVLGALLVSEELSTFVFSAYGNGTSLTPEDFLRQNPSFIQDTINRAEIKLDRASKLALAAAMPTQGDGSVDLNGTITYDQLPESIRQSVEGASTEELLSSLRVDGLTISSVSPNTLNDPAAANMFTKQATRLGTWMLSTNGKALSAAEVRRLGLGPNLGEKLDVIANVGTDDNAEEQARVVLRSGLTTQIALQTGLVQSTLNGPAFATAGATYDRENGTFTFTNQAELVRNVALLQGYDASKLDQIKATTPQYFDASGSLVIPATPTAGEPAWLANFRRVLPDEYRNVVSYTETIGTLSQARDSLTVDMPEDQAVLPPASGGPATSGVTYAADLLRGFEGFRESPYYDVNAFRAGYGSDTITREDGSVVTVREGMSVTREDAERDLARRSREFFDSARAKVGANAWDNLTSNVQGALTSITYNYGSLPDRLLTAVRSGDVEAIATAVEGLADDNDGINRRRRMEEARIIRSAAPIDAQAFAVAQEVARTQDTQTGPAPSVQTSVAQPTQPVATGTTPDMPTDVSTTAFQRTPDQPQEPQRDTPAVDNYIPDDVQAALTAIASGGQPMTGVAAFATYEDFKKALDAGEINQGQWVIVDGRALRA